MQFELPSRPTVNADTIRVGDMLVIEPATVVYVDDVKHDGDVVTLFFRHGRMLALERDADVELLSRDPTPQQ